MRNNVAERTIPLRIILGWPSARDYLKGQSFLTSLLGGLIFVLVFHWAYSDIPGDFYQVRDDGVITMSHARNLVDYGFIGVNPSGGRVEGYSAPTQLFLYAAAYAATGIGYTAYSEAQTVAATFLLGALLPLFFRERKLLALGLAGGVAVFLIYMRPFLLWHGSGMENAVTHILVLATLLILFSSIRRRRLNYWFILPIFLASISRIEGIYYIGPLLVGFGGFWFVAFKDLRGVRFSLIVLGLHVLFQLWRYLYFGDLLPNTAYAQAISVADNLRLLFSLDWGDLRERIFLENEILDLHGGKVLLPVLVALLMLSRRRETVLLVLLMGISLLVAAFSESIFGPARIDRVRTTTHLGIVSGLGIAFLFYFLMLHRRTYWVALVAVGALVFGTHTIDPYPAGWGTMKEEDLMKEDFGFIRRSGIDNLFRPTLANPDLGSISWSKRFNIIDLGKLGSPLIAKLSPPFRGDWLFDYAAPDIISLHNAWSCLYDTEIFSDPRFTERYTEVEARVSSWTKQHCHANPESLTGTWVRTAVLDSSQSFERRLIDRMKRDLSIREVREELEKCQSRTAELSGCIYVARTAWRFLPEFRNLGRTDELEEIFTVSRTAPFDLFLITGYRDGQAHQAAARFIRDHHK